jgi:hypothetical protein
VRAHGPERALSELRRSITALNESHGNANTDTDGYHETITAAYVTVIAAFLAERPLIDIASCVRALLASPLAHRDCLLAFYSRERLMSVAARRAFVEPDLLPLPRSD